MHAWARAAVVAAGIALVAAGCSTGADDDLEQQLVEVTAERDALQAELDAISARHDKSAAVKADVEAILADPESYGTPAEVAALLAGYATEDAVMDDDAFGAIGYEQAWYNTLSNGLEAEIETVQQWIDEDGSVSGSLWIWRGVNYGGHPFELIGINVDSHDDDGLITREWVAYPYPDSFVNEAITGAGTPTTALGEAWGSQEE